MMDEHAPHTEVGQYMQSQQLDTQDLDLSKVYEFLSYLVVNNELSTYFYLLNEVQIEKFSNSVLVLATKDGKIDMVEFDVLRKCLFEWTGSKWDVIITRNKSGAISIKENLRNNFFESNEWKLIQDNFSASKLVDIYSKHSK